MKHTILKLFILIGGILLFLNLNGQYITTEPSNPNPENEITVYFDASEGNKELMGESSVYFHHGVVTNSPTSQSWKYVIGNWGQDDGVGKMTKVAGTTDTWSYTFSPSLRTYFNVPANENIFRISGVFRNKDGSKKGSSNPGIYDWGIVASNGDVFINLDVNGYVTITKPVGPGNIYDGGQIVQIEAIASANVSKMTISIDEGNGPVEVQSINSGTKINYQYGVSETKSFEIFVDATIFGKTVSASKEYYVILKSSIPEIELPEDMVPGINYDKNDFTKATLVLEAPGKDIVFAVGDFNDWKINTDYIMNKTPDGEIFWIELDNLIPNNPYVFQYWINGGLKIADPYTRLVADPQNDKFIDPSVFPNLPMYDKVENGIASVLHTGVEEYNWSAAEETFQRPDVDHLMIYELHMRDFLASGSYFDLVDTLDYLAKLGINAIELMPVSEFEGNDSWGYNPSFYFAPDKAYGTADELKKFIELAHERGIAVILDMVLNHSYGQNPMVFMYFDRNANKPALDNPWFNREYVGPFEWGYDFNHESPYTKQFVDRVNKYWLEEFHFDGFRFDFTKGFTNRAPGNSLDSYDASRIAIVSRMAQKIWEVDQEAYVILEHFGSGSEEKELGQLGMKMWSNRSYDYVPAATGSAEGSFIDVDRTTHVSYFNSHDERRIAEHILTEGRISGSYNLKDTTIMLERVKQAAAFAFLQPGPKMMWQFDELGYDIDINFNGRVGRKPLPWGDESLGYYDDPLRQYVYQAYQGIIELRNIITPQALELAATNHLLSGTARRLVYDLDGTDLVVISNFGINETEIDPAFTETGKWYNYFSGDSLVVENQNDKISLAPGEWHIFTTEKISDGFPDVVATFRDPVTITPYPFTVNDEITILFDASIADPDGTEGLLQAEKVYMHAGLVTTGFDHTEWQYTKGNLIDDGLGLMTRVEGSDHLWELTIIPKDYFELQEGDNVYRMGMFFRDAENNNLGKGFRGKNIYKKVDDDQPFITITPAPFEAETEITLTLNVAKGHGELQGADKIYMHSGVITDDTANPQNANWVGIVGNWGMDDGIGEMTKVSPEGNLWQIKLTPKTYYNLSGNQHPYWIAVVFRNANGNLKATADQTAVFNGISTSNGDFFLQNSGTVSAADPIILSHSIFPNPTLGLINLSNFQGILDFTLYNLSGQEVFATRQHAHHDVNISHLSPGMYIYYLRSTEGIKTGKIVLAN